MLALPSRDAAQRTFGRRGEHPIAAGQCLGLDSLRMAAVKFPTFIFIGALAGCAFAGFLVIKQQYHPNTENGGLFAYGWFSPRVEKVLTTDQLVAPASAGPETASYIHGELDASLSNGLDSVVNTLNGVIAQFHLTKVSETRAASSVVIIARTGHDEPVEFKMAAAANDVTKVAIRVADETLARAIFERTKANL